MRERYLYKAKRIDNGEWIEGYYQFYTYGYGSEDREGHIIRDGKSNLYFVDESTICQCTGLKDINGNLIWENDIVKISEHEYLVNGIYEVIYSEITFQWILSRSIEYHYNSFNFSDLNGFYETSEVIGNKFDNPELLEVE